MEYYFYSFIFVSNIKDMSYYYENLNTDEDVIGFLKTSQKEGKIVKFAENDDFITADVAWAFNFQGHKVERRKFIYRLTISEFVYNRESQLYIRPKDHLLNDRRTKTFELLQKILRGVLPD